MHEHLQIAASPNHVAVIGGRLLETADVQIAAISVEVNPRLIVKARGAEAGLADVIHAGPDEVAEHPRITLRRRQTFAVDLGYDSVPAMMRLGNLWWSLRVLPFLIVVAADVKERKRLLGVAIGAG